MDEMDRYIRIFRDEALEQLETLRAGLLRIEERGSAGGETSREILRCAHTLKGSARMVGLAEIGDLAHKMEDVLKGLERGQIGATSEVISLMLESADMVRDGVEAAARGTPFPGGLPDLVARVQAAAPKASTIPGKPAPAPPPEPKAADPGGMLNELESLFGAEEGAVPEPLEVEPAAPPPQAPAPAAAADPGPPRLPGPPRAGKTRVRVPSSPSAMETIRVDVKKLDDLTNLAGELVINRIRVENKYYMARDLTKNLAAFVEEEEETLAVPLEAWIPQLRGKVRDELKSLVEELSRDIQEMDTLVSELQTLTLDLRLLPVSTLFDAYHRTVRDLRTALGKRVALEVSGRETLIDKRVLEEINPALIHVIRNAVDHGIENPEDRRAAGKPPEGTIRLEAFNEGGNVVIRVTDDGAGMDAERIRRKAVDKGILSEEDAAGLTEREVLNLVFRYGFSTSPIITDLSGRGVGLNVVWEKVEDLKGNVFVDTLPGKHTAVTLSFPPTYFTLNALVVKVGPEIVALPSNFLVETLWAEPGDISLEGGRPVLSLRGQVHPLVDLRRFLGFPGEDPLDARRHAVVIATFRAEILALRVDKILRFEDEVVKSSGPFLQGHPFVSGVTILRKGEPCFILNVYDIFKYAREWREGAEIFQKGKERRPRKRVLVVDDSITTRTLEKSILENAGYDVVVARDGREALSMAGAEVFRLVVTDVEMPGLTGFELTKALRADLRYRDIPVIIVTSLARDEDRRRGIEVGAQAYIVKGTFDQRHLLDTVRSLIG